MLEIQDDEGPSVTIEELQSRCEVLLSDLQQFYDHLKSQRREHTVELRTFQGNIRADLKALQKIDVSHEKLTQMLRSSNVPFYEAVWKTAQKSKGVIGFSQRYYWDTKDKTTAKTKDAERIAKPRNLKYKNSALVDVVAEDGTTWIKVSTVTQTRLIWELARQGWNPQDDESDFEDDASNSSEDSESEVSILKMAQDLYTASQHTHVHFKHPKIHLVLTRLQEPLSVPAASLLKRIQSISPRITISLNDSAFLANPAPTLSEAFNTGLVIDPLNSLTPTINIDCTILLALVSNLSHVKDGAVEREAWFHKATIRQLEVEANEALLPETLYPAMAGRDLVCTIEAAQRMREIVETIATDSERRRTALLLDDGSAASQVDKEMTREMRTAAWAKLSEYPLPEDLRLPIRVVSASEATQYPGALETAVADKVSDELSSLNQSVFLYGWRAGVATLTSNRTVAKLVEVSISEQLDSLAASSRSRHDKTGQEDEPNFVGPNLWLCRTSRSLIGKEKSRK
jgi:hypothetical protein